MNARLRPSAVWCGVWLASVTWVVAGTVPDSAAGRPPRAPGDRTFVAMLRSEGVIVPFAEYTDAGWKNPGANAGATPGRLPPVWFSQAGASPRDWTVQFTNGEQRPTQTNTAALVQSHCSPQWGLLSDIGDQPLPMNSTRRQVGMAVSGDAAVDGFAALDRNSADTVKLTVPLLQTFDRDEDAAFSRWAASGRGPVPPAIDRHSVPFVIEAAFRSRVKIQDRSVIYIRVSRTHHESLEPSSACTRMSVLDTWMFEDDQGHTVVASSSRFLSGECGRRDAPAGMPFGIVRVAGHTFLVGVDYGPDTEDYRIWAVTDNDARHVLSTAGGKC